MSIAKKLIKFFESMDSSEFKSIAREVWDYDNVEDFIKAQQEIELPKYKKLADSIFYKHHQEAQKIVDFISDSKKLVDLYNQVRGDK